MVEVSVMVTQLVSVPAEFQDQLREARCESNLLGSFLILLAICPNVEPMSQVPGGLEQASGPHPCDLWPKSGCRKQ